MVAERNPVTGQNQQWIPPDDISDIFFKFKCRITDIAKALNIHRATLYEHFKINPELKALFDKVREDIDNEWIDQSEKVFWYALSLAETRPALAVSTAKYIAERRGKKRGWEGMSEQVEHVPKYDEVLETIHSLRKDYSAFKHAEMSSNEESKS